MNSKNILAFLEAAKHFAEQLKDLNPELVVLLHHNDSDGLSSGAILSKAIERAHFSSLRYCLEKPYPLVLKQIFENDLLPKKTVFIFTDFASGMLKTLAKLNSKSFDIFVIDHHGIEAIDNSKIHLFNCLSFGIDGSTECSASSAAYTFAEALSIDNSDLLSLAVLGAIGDKHIPGGNNQSLNAKVLEQAKHLSLVDDLLFFNAPHNCDGRDLAGAIDIMGSIGYLQGGPDVAIKGLYEGFDQRYFEQASRFESEYNLALHGFVQTLKLQQAKNIQWFILPEEFENFGVKTVGLVCEALIAKGLVDSSKYLAGFQKVPNQIPGIGDMDLNQSKISMRLPKEIAEKVFQKKLPALGNILPQAVAKVGGFVDACHKHAAAATVEIGRESQLVEEIDQFIRP